MELNPIKVYNTASQKKEEFVPLRENRVTMYVCGITAYDYAHIGHARAAVIFDVIFRYLTYRGYQVAYVRNFTDVDDKIIKRANDEGVSGNEIAQRYIKAYTEDMHRLGVKPPQHEPLATEHIDDIIAMIKRLIDRGYAYSLDGDVYFEVKKFSEYGKLSKKNIDDQLAGARVEMDKRKKDPRDFALWKKAKPNEPFWPSPWGEGRPGWHIECSVMSRKYLGATLDIHGGGRDLIFPHHENEVAQSEAATGKPFVRYWIHNGFVKINREKMSKSLGNFFTVKDMLEDYHPEVVRLFLLSHHYRSPVDFSSTAMQKAEGGLERIYTTLGEIDELVGKKDYPDVEEGRLKGADREIYQELIGLQENFEKGMDDDFNTAVSIGSIYQTIRSLNKYLSRREFAKTDEVCAILSEGRAIICRIGEVLGLFQVLPADYLKMMKNRKLAQLKITVSEIERMVKERNQAREDKEWARADEIRDSLLNNGIILEDGKGTTAWKVK